MTTDPKAPEPQHYMLSGSVAALAGQEGEHGLDMTATWYFDGEKHLRLRTGRFPKIVHPGARARLYHAYGLDRLYPGSTARTRLLKTSLGFRVMRINPLQKATLLKWDSSAFLISPHKTDLAASKTILLPIQHFRFCGAVYRKIELALREKSYRPHSAGYSLLSELLKTMEEKNGSFLYRNQKRIRPVAVLAGADHDPSVRRVWADEFPEQRVSDSNFRQSSFASRIATGIYRFNACQTNAVDLLSSRERF